MIPCFICSFCFQEVPHSEDYDYHTCYEVGDQLHRRELKLFLDDVRDPPDTSWHVVRTAQQCIDFMRVRSNLIDVASFDHDLGSETETGYTVMKWIEREVVRDKDFWPPKSIVFHTSNPVGRMNMYRAAMSISALLEKRV